MGGGETFSAKFLKKIKQGVTFTLEASLRASTSTDLAPVDP